MSSKPQVTNWTGIPMFSLISELERSLVTDNMLVRIHKEKGLEKQVKAIQGFIDISRRYLTLGFEKKASFAYLRALALYSNICSQ